MKFLAHEVFSTKPRLGWCWLASGPQGLPRQPRQGLLAQWLPLESQRKRVTPVIQQAWNLHVTSTN